MRFVVTGEWTRNRLLAIIVWFTLAYACLFWLTSTLLYFDEMGLSYQSVVGHYLGDEAAFRQPRTYRGLLEVSHFHVFAMGMLLLTLTHLLLFVPIEMTWKAGLIPTAFVSGLCNEASGWLIRYAHPGFAYLKIASFFILQGTIAALIALVAWSLATNGRNAYADSEPRRPESGNGNGNGCPRIDGDPARAGRCH